MSVQVRNPGFRFSRSRADLYDAHPEPGDILLMLEVAEFPGVTLCADEILGGSAPQLG